MGGAPGLFPMEKSMSSDVSSPQVPSKPRAGMLVVSASALALAVTGGVVAGFVWSGGGPAAVATPTAKE